MDFNVACRAFCSTAGGYGYRGPAQPSVRSGYVLLSAVCCLLLSAVLCYAVLPFVHVPPVLPACRRVRSQEAGQKLIQYGMDASPDNQCSDKATSVSGLSPPTKIILPFLFLFFGGRGGKCVMHQNAERRRVWDSKHDLPGGLCALVPFTVLPTETPLRRWSRPHPAM